MRCAIGLGIALAAVGCGQSGPTAVTPSPTVVDESTSEPPAAVGLGCADIGGKFVAHGVDGRGDCMSADPRPQCHLAPGDQPDGNYVAELPMDPPTPDGVLANPAAARIMIQGASNADCWRLPRG